MTDEAKLKALRIVLVLVGLTFVFAIWPLTSIWPSGWSWHSGTRHGAGRTVSENSPTARARRDARWPAFH